MALKRQVGLLVALLISALSCAGREVRLYQPSEVCRPGPAATVALPDALITDAEDGKNQIAVHDGREGFIYFFSDRSSDVVRAPQAEQSRPAFVPVLGGAGGSRCALNLRGTIAGFFDTNRPAFAGLGINLKAPKAPYDASRFAGITFLARRSSGSSARVAVKFQDWNTVPPGCTDCFNNFQSELMLTEQWTRYSLPFTSLAQLPGWGAPRPAHMDAARLYGFTFELKTPGEPFDIWIDDIAFLEDATPAN